MSKMTFQPKKISHARVHGFRARMSTKGGRKVLSARRRKGRKVLSAWSGSAGTVTDAAAPFSSLKIS